METKEEGLKSWRFTSRYDVSFVALDGVIQWNLVCANLLWDASNTNVVVRTIKVSIYFLAAMTFLLIPCSVLCKEFIRKCTRCFVIGDGVTRQAMIKGFVK